jgi:hypothetical protein
LLYIPSELHGKSGRNSGREAIVRSGRTKGLLSEGQFGRRKGQSAIHPAAIIIDRAYAPWTNGNITVVLGMDIKAAFPPIA